MTFIEKIKNYTLNIRTKVHNTFSKVNKNIQDIFTQPSQKYLQMMHDSNLIREVETFLRMANILIENDDVLSSSTIEWYQTSFQTLAFGLNLRVIAKLKMHSQDNRVIYVDLLEKQQLFSDFTLKKSSFNPTALNSIEHQKSEKDCQLMQVTQNYNRLQANHSDISDHYSALKQSHEKLQQQLATLQTPDQMEQLTNPDGISKETYDSLAAKYAMQSDVLSRKEHEVLSLKAQKTDASNALASLHAEHTQYKESSEQLRKEELHKYQENERLITSSCEKKKYIC